MVAASPVAFFDRRICGELFGLAKSRAALLMRGSWEESDPADASLDHDLLQQADEAGRQMGMSRSRILAAAISEFLHKKKQEDQPSLSERNLC